MKSTTPSPAASGPTPDSPSPVPSGALLGLSRLALGAVNGALSVLERLAWPIAPRRTERVAIFRIGMIGDVLVSLPAIHAVRRAHPDAELTLVSSPGRQGMPGARELLNGSSDIDRLLTYHAEDVATRRGRWALLRRLRARRFDRVYVLPPELTRIRTEFRNLAFWRLAGARWVRGFAVHNARCLPQPLATAHHHGSHFRPEWRRQLELLSSRAGLPIGTSADQRAELPRPVAVVELADRLEYEHDLEDRPLLALAPGAKLLHKRWPAERFGAVARSWIDAGGRVCVLGGAGDRELARTVRESADRDVIDLTGATDLLTSAELLRRATALVSNDTGTMHLGATVGVPLVAIFSGQNRPDVWHPWPGGPQRILREPVGCSPCFESDCPHAKACLTRIDTDRVLRALSEVATWPGSEPPSEIEVDRPAGVASPARQLSDSASSNPESSNSGPSNQRPARD